VDLDLKGRNAIVTGSASHASNSNRPDIVVSKLRISRVILLPSARRTHATTLSSWVLETSTTLKNDLHRPVHSAVADVRTSSMNSRKHAREAVVPPSGSIWGTRGAPRPTS
jgi:hypothetical protein